MMGICGRAIHSARYSSDGKFGAGKSNLAGTLSAAARNRHAQSGTMDSLPTAPYLALKAAMMPCDTNHVGTVFGGVLLSYIDQAGAVGAIYEIGRQGWPQQPLVTVALNTVEFHQPVFVGDVVSFWT